MNRFFAPMINRRQMLNTVGAGTGMLGLAQVLSLAGDLKAGSSLGQLAETHFPAKAKRVIVLSMSGGPSQIDTFDPKPHLKKYEGQRPNEVDVRTERQTGGILPSPVNFTPAGESGMPFSEHLTRLSQYADDIAVIRSMHTDSPNHAPALCMMNLGLLTPTRPSVGSWLTYGLGTENQDLPGYLAICPGNPVVGPKLWGNAFLPGQFQGTYINSAQPSPEAMIPNLRNQGMSATEQKRQLDLISSLNREHQQSRAEDANLETRINSMELAYRMQFAGMDAFDLQLEPASVHEAYGESSFAKSCLLARRLSERGVRFVQVFYGDGQPWDTHSNHTAANAELCRDIDGPISQLIQDLKSRGLFEETLILWAGEFGRTPTSEGGNGRDHNPFGFSVWLAGGGIKGGTIYGATDDFGCRSVQDKVHVHDLHATMLHLMGIDHEKLTYHYSGRNFRLTDVHGRVVKDILA